MLERSELQALTQWCQGHFIRWMPAAEDGGRPAMVLEGDHRRRSWKRMFLILGDEGFCLVTENGETLATASDLPAVLDTLNDEAPTPVRMSPPRASFRRHAVERSVSYVI